MIRSILVYLAALLVLLFTPARPLAAVGAGLLAQAAAAEPPAPPASAPVQALLAEARRQQQAGQAAEALKVAEQALSAARQAGDAAGEARSHWARGLALRQLGRTSEAVAAWRESAAAWKRAGDGPGQVLGLSGAGMLLVADRPAEAQPLMDQAVAVGRAETRRPLAAAGALEAAGDGCMGLGRLERARDLWAAAVALRSRFAPGSLELARDLDQLGRLARSLGDLPSAKEDLRQAVGIFTRLSPDSAELAATLATLGAVSHQLGDLTTAGEAYRRALPLEEKLAPDSLDLAAILGDVGLVAYKQGDLTTARRYLTQAQALYQKHAPASADLATCYDNLGAVAHVQGDLVAARDYYLQALALQHRIAPGSSDEAMSLNNLGTVFGDQGNLGLAAEIYRRVLAIDEKVAPDSLVTAEVLNNLGAVAFQRGDLKQARALYQRSFTIKKKLAPGSLAVASTLNNLALVALQQGDRPAAGDYLHQALSLLEKLAPGSLELAGTLKNIAELAGQRGNWAAAEHWARQAWALARRQAMAVQGDEARQGFGSSTASLTATLLQAQVALGHRAAAFETMEEGRAQALLQMLLDRRVIAGMGHPRAWPAYQAAAAARDRAEQAVSQASVEAARARRAMEEAQEEKRSPAELARAQQAFFAAAGRLEAAQLSFTRRRLKADQLWGEAQKGAVATTSLLSLAEAGKCLTPGELYAAFAVGPERTYLFCLRRGRGAAPKLTVLEVPGSEDRLGQLVHAFRSQVTAPGAGAAEVAAGGRALFARLFPGPARQEVLAARRLLISPYGPLWELPFAALVVNAHGPPRYLGEIKPLVYTPSLTLLAQSRRDRPRRPRGAHPFALVVGDPLFARGEDGGGGTAGTRVARRPRPPAPPGPGRERRGPAAALVQRAFLLGEDHPPPRLPGTRDEAIQVARLYHTSPLLAGDATEAAVRREIERADVIHLATHGYLNPYRPMSSGVLLAPPASGSRPAGDPARDDGVLQAWEIHSELRLKAEMVVLSACETARGANVLGEGIVGLTRALEFAGARSVVASQWSVADASTRRLMVTFHQRLLRGLPKDEALRQAMSIVRREPRTASPYYWAAFILTGDPDNPPFFHSAALR